MKMMFRPFAALAVLFLGFAAPASAQIAVDITQGNIQPLPIAVPAFVPYGNDNGASARIAEVIRADLERSGLFRPLDPKSFVDRINDINTVPGFANWRVINAQALVAGAVTVQPDGRLQVNFRLWDVTAGSQMLGMQYTSTPENWRRLAHMVADAVYERITGEKGYFDTRIVFVSESGPALNRAKRLTIMDQDGANPSYLTPTTYMVLTPRFNPTAQMIAYMSYIGGKPRVYLFDLETGRQERLGDFPNMTFSPRFSPDGNRVAMTLETNGNSDIYIMDLRNRAMTRLTSDPGIDTAPSFSPDGSQIVFESDRGGTQQVYVMNADGSNQRRISFGTGRNGTPVWSPRGDLVAFTKQANGRFNIGVMRPDGSAERVISTGAHDEGPTWAPNGRVLMYTREARGNAPAQIWSIDVFGRNERRVQTPGSASDPAWSPRIQ